MRSPLRIEGGSSSPRRSTSSGFSSNRSCCARPPDRNTTTTRLAFASGSRQGGAGSCSSGAPIVGVDGVGVDWRADNSENASEPRPNAPCPRKARRRSSVSRFWACRFMASSSPDRGFEVEERGADLCPRGGFRGVELRIDLGGADGEQRLGGLLVRLVVGAQVREQRCERLELAFFGAPRSDEPEPELQARFVFGAAFLVHALAQRAAGFD